MMLANSVAMFTIACSLFQLGFGGVPHSAIPSENTVTSLPPIEMMNTTISTIAPSIPDESSKVQTVESSTELLEKIRDIMRLKKAVNVSNDNSQVKQYFQLLKKNIELDLHAKFETLQSRVLELENDQNHQRNIMKEKDILISELSLGTLELSAKLYQSQEKLSNITEQYIKLEKSYLTVQKQIETHNDELDNEKKKHSIELLNLNTEVGQLKENNKKCTDQQGVLDKSLEIAKSDLVKIEETLSVKSAELENLKQKNSIDLLNLNTEIGQLKDNNKKCTDQQGVLEKELTKNKDTLSIKSSELENLKQKNSIDLHKLNTEVVQEKDKNKKCMDQQGILEKILETTKLDLVKDNEALSLKTAELKNCEEKSTAGFTWVKYSGVFEIVPGMVKIGSDHGGFELVIGRASHNGDILPAKVKHELGIAYVPYNGKEYEKRDYEILFGTHFDWVHVENRQVPSNAVPVGKTIDGEILYVGRKSHNGVVCAGKVDPKSNKLLIPYAGKEIEYDSYDVLVMH